MARLPKMAHLALVTSLLGGSALVPVVLSGPASAQAGSRICGRIWYQDRERDADSKRAFDLNNDPTKEMEVIFKIYEVDKKDFLGATCNQAEKGGGSDKDPTLAPKGVRGDLVYDDWREDVIRMAECEDFTKRVRDVGELKYKTDGIEWKNQNQDDICNAMFKSGDVFGMVAHWLIFNSKTDGKVRVYHG